MTTQPQGRTPGEWTVRGDGREVGTEKPWGTPREGYPTASVICYAKAHVDADRLRAQANARTIALAGTAANAVDSLGLDGDAAIRELPELIRALDSCVTDSGAHCWDGDDVVDEIDRLTRRLRAVNESARAVLAKLRRADGGEGAR